MQSQHLLKRGFAITSDGGALLLIVVGTRMLIGLL
jgi:hypothetical protein